MNLNTLKESFKKGQDKIKNLATGAALFGILAGAPSCSNDKPNESTPEEVKTEQVEKNNNLAENTQTPTITAKTETNSNDELDDLDDLSNLDLTEEAKKYEGQLAPHELLAQEAEQTRREAEQTRRETESLKQEEEALIKETLQQESEISKRDVNDMNKSMALALFSLEKWMKLAEKPLSPNTKKLLKAAYQFKKDNPHLFSK